MVKSPYQRLAELYTDQEIAEDFVLPSAMPPEVLDAAMEEIGIMRREQLAQLSDAQKKQMKLIQMRLQIEDYIQRNVFDPAFLFSVQLRKYIQITGLSMTTFAQHIGIHKAQLSRIINHHDMPNVALMHRLQHHSHDLIPATYWFRLHTMAQEYTLKTDHDRYLAETRKVTQQLLLPS